MASLMFYEKPVELDKRVHSKTRFINEGRKYAFARNTNSVILSGVEFSDAGKEFPVVFVSGSEDKVVPVALLGLKNSENLFVDASGDWLGRYIPAFVRRYPFALAEVEDGLRVCIDSACGALQEKEGEPLFDDEGNNSPFLDSVLTFLREFQQEHQRTESFVKKLQELELLKPLNASVKLPDGEQLALQGLLVVDEPKLLELEDKAALSLFRSGELGWIYTHLASIVNLGRLADRVSQTQADLAD
ncbi:MAG: SapC family protein [Endozoicomonas sp.]